MVRLGLPEPAKPVLAAAIAARQPGPTVLLTSTPGRSRSLLDEIALFDAGVPLARLPEQERLPYEFARDDPAVIYERGRATSLLRGPGPALIVASWAALAEHCGEPQGGDESSHIRVAQGLDPGALASVLEARGYQRSSYVDRPGTFARHGGVIDVFAAGGDRAFRIEFFGNEVESIRQLDVATQRSSGRLEEARLPAASVATPAARARAADLAARLTAESPEAERVVEQLQLIAGGERTPYQEFFTAFLARATALDHLAPGGVVLLDEPDDGAQALGTLAEQHERARLELERRGAIPRGLPPILESVSNIAAALESRHRIALHRFGSDELGARRLDFGVPPGFAGKLRVLVQQARAWAEEGRHVVIASQQALRIAELLDEDGVPHRLGRTLALPPARAEISLAPIAVSGGFTLGQDLVVISDAEVFGFRKRRRPTRTGFGVRTDLVASITPGDYLVHADHGIARFGGLTRRTVDGIEREYLELQYAEGDRLYVPADQMEAVSRYIGPGDHPPVLTRLGSQEWARTRRRVRQAVAEMAHDLLDLYARREVASGHAFPPDTSWQLEMEAAFPFVETPDQVQAIGEVKADMESPRPMDRLICGDVGYGKTEVAIRAAFKAVMDGRQVAVLVPTTVLAEQHGATFRERSAGFPVRVEVLSRFRSEHDQHAIVGAIATGEVDIAIGTHRLLSRDVSFKDLGLVIVDEEQRFGVGHKERLKQMRAEVDCLTLSATPIPRTLQMSLSGVRDMSTIMTPPEERLPIRTYVSGWDDEIIREAIQRELGRGGQVYFVHNRVQSIERMLARLREIVPDAAFAVGHGQMPEEQLERIMVEFAAGEYDVLVCTTIIESGLDIPNVNTIIINNANQLGLAQLYQLRGRVGRAAARAFAYLVYDRDQALSEASQKRLEAIFEATDLGAGFQIALRDLEIRGAGNLLGPEQSGHIAAVGLELYTKLLGEAVAALKAALGGETQVAPPPVPAPTIDLPVSAHIPSGYIDDLNTRLATYQRVADLASPEAVAEMQTELRDRFGGIPPAVESLLYVALVKALAREAGVESIATDPEMIHVRLRGGTSAAQRKRVEAMDDPGILAGPMQVRIDRGLHSADWIPLLAKVLRQLRAGSA